MMREAVKDAMAERGITQEDLQEALLKAEPPTKTQAQ